MTERKWTKGPWHVSQNADDLAAYITEKPCGKGRVAKVWMGRSAQQANANLISAAPDLYDALWTLHEHAKMYIPHLKDGFSVDDMVNAALAKARGEK